MNGKPDGTNARSEARAELVCREVREDIVALQRDELSPLRAESIRLHLASCAECREEAMGLELASRDLTKLPELSPPPGLIETTMRRFQQGRVVGKTKIIIGTEIDQLGIPTLGVNAGTLGRDQRTLLLVQALVTDVGE